MLDENADNWENPFKVISHQTPVQNGVAEFGKVNQNFWGLGCELLQGWLCVFKRWLANITSYAKNTTKNWTILQKAESRLLKK